MFPKGHGMCRNGGMGMVGGGHQHSIYAVLHLIKHHAPVLEQLGFRKIAKGTSSVSPVGITQSHDVLRLHETEVASAHTSHAYTGYIEFVTRSHMAELLSKHGTGHHHQRSSTQAATLEKFPSRQLIHMQLVLVLSLYLMSLVHKIPIHLQS